MRISNWKTCTLLLSLTVGSPIAAFADATPTAPIGTMDCGQHQATDDEFLLIYDAKTGQITRPHRTLYGNQELVVCISNLDHRNVYRATATLTDLPPPLDPTTLIKSTVTKSARDEYALGPNGVLSLSAKVRLQRRLLAVTRQLRTSFDQPILNPDSLLAQMQAWQVELDALLDEAQKEEDLETAQKKDQAPAQKKDQAPANKKDQAVAQKKDQGPVPQQKSIGSGTPAIAGVDVIHVGADGSGTGDKVTQRGSGDKGNDKDTSLPGSGLSVRTLTEQVDELGRAMQLLRQHFERSRKNVFRIALERDKKVEVALFRQRSTIKVATADGSAEESFQIVLETSERVAYTSLEAHSLSYFRVNVGVVYTFLQDTGYRTAINAGGEPSIVTDKSGSQVLPMLVLSHYWGGTDPLAPCPLSSDRTACPRRNLFPTFAIGIPLTQNPFENFFLGGMWQPFPGIGVTGGLHVGKVTVLRDSFEVGGRPPTATTGFMEKDLITTAFRPNGYVGVVLTSDIFVKILAKVIK